MSSKAARRVISISGTGPTRPSAVLGEIEGAESAFAFTSGMAAKTAAFLTHGRQGILCIGDAYGGT
jgi:cystathionine beta-lyase/cystathionine gamma-synthase